MDRVSNTLGLKFLSIAGSKNRLFKNVHKQNMHSTHILHRTSSIAGATASPQVEVKESLKIGNEYEDSESQFLSSAASKNTETDPTEGCRESYLKG